MNRMFGRVAATTASVAIAASACNTPSTRTETLAERSSEAPATAESVAAAVKALRTDPNTYRLERSSAEGSLTVSTGVDRMGNATASVPLAVAPGIRGMQPSIRLQYNSGRGGGSVGVGWAVSTGQSSIVRARRSVPEDGYAAPPSFHDDDALALDGKRLILVDGQAGADGAIYAFKRSPGTKIVLHGGLDSPDAQFEVFAASGQISTYEPVKGSVLDSGKTYSWLLVQVRDRYGNAMNYEYGVPRFLDPEDWKIPELKGDLKSQQESKLLKITYTEDVGTVGSPVAPTREVEFKYAEREIAGESYLYGTARHDASLLWGIESRALDEVYRTYRLDYRIEDEETDRIKLSSVTVRDTNNDALPPLTFEYEPGTRQRLMPTFQDYPGLADPDLEDYYVFPRDATQLVMADANGDGKLGDFFWAYAGEYHAQSPGTTDRERCWHVWDPSSNVRVDTYVWPLGVQTPPSWTILKPGSPAATDFNHDGLDDLVSVFTSACRSSQTTDCTGAGEIPAGSRFYAVHRESASEDYSWTIFEDDSDKPIIFSQMADMDGDGTKDIIACRGHDPTRAEEGEPADATWAFGRNLRVDGEWTYQFVDTDIACSNDQEFQLADYNGARSAKLLIIPAWYPGARGGDARIPEDERGDYRPLEVTDWDTGEAVVGDEAVLPRDLLLRWWSVPGGNYYGSDSPRAGSGPGKYKPLDWNGDGLVDLVTYELVSGNRPENLAEIRSIYDPADNGVLSPLPSTPGGIRIYYNTGDGFESGPWIKKYDDFDGYYKHFRSALPIDYNSDGRTDLMLPAVSPSHEYEVIISGPSTDVDDVDDLATPEAGETEETPVPYPDVATAHYRGGYLRTADVDGDGMQDFLDFTSSRISMLTSGGRTRPNLLRTITDGDGYQRHVVYGRANDLDLHERLKDWEDDHFANSEEPYNAPQPLVRELLAGGESAASADVRTAYHYKGGLVDAGGRGFLGFREITTETTVDGETSYGATVYNLEYSEERDDYPHLGRVEESRSLTPVSNSDYIQPPASDDYTRTLVSTERYEYEVADVQWSGGAWSRLVSTTTRHEEVDNTQFGNQVQDIYGPHVELTASSTTTFGHDDYGHSNHEFRETGDGSVLIVDNDLDFNEDTWLMTSSHATMTAIHGGEHAVREVEGTYNAHGLPEVTTKAPQGEDDVWLQTTAVYNDRGQLTQETQSDRTGLSRVDELHWDQHGFLAGATNSLKHRSHVIANPVTGQLVAAVDPNGLTVSTGYDGFGRQVSERYESFPVDGERTGAGARWIYELRNESARGVRGVATLAEDGSTDYRELDSRGRVVYAEQSGLAENTYQRFWYNNKGNLTRASRSAFVGDLSQGSSKWTYDAAGRTRLATGPDGSETRWRYSGPRTWRTDPEVDGEIAQTFTRVDHQGRPIETVDPEGLMSTFAYSPFGDLKTVTRCPGCRGSGTTGGLDTLVSEWVFDDWGRTIRAESPESGVYTMRYNAFDEQISTTDAAGITTIASLDKLGRQTDRESLDLQGNLLDSAHWDYDGQRLGALDGSSNAAFSQTYEYDNFGRVKTHTARPFLMGEPRSMEYRYNALNQLEEVGYPDVSAGRSGPTVRNVYVNGVQQGVIDTFDGSKLWELTQVNADGNPLHEGYANGVETTREYNLKTGLIERIDTGKPPIEIPIPGLHDPTQSLQYAWNARGELAERQDHLRAQAEAFAYDRLGRLTREYYRRGSLEQTSTNQYDALGNFTHRDRVGSYSYDEAGRLTLAGSIRLSYDDNGRVTRRGGDYLNRDALGRVESIESSSSAYLAFKYTPEGDRFLRRATGGGTEPSSVLSLFGGLYEQIGDDHHYRVFANGRVVTQIKLTETVEESRFGTAFRIERTRTFFHDDHLGSTDVISDEEGWLKAGQSYDAWGERRAPQAWNRTPSSEPEDDENIGFTGHPARLDAGLINMGARLYDPHLGRFMSPDPIVADMFNAQAHNAYSYVFNSPLSYTDPTGMVGERVGDFKDYKVGETTSTKAGDVYQLEVDENGEPVMDQIGGEGQVVEVRAERGKGTPIGSEPPAPEQPRQQQNSQEGNKPSGSSPRGGSTEGIDPAIKVSLEIATGLTPVGPLVDAYDTTESLITFSLDPSLKNLGNVGLNAVGFVPLAGDAIKIAGKFAGGLGALGKLGGKALANAGRKLLDRARNLAARGPRIVSHPSKGAARRAAQREAGMGKHGAREALPDQPLGPGSQAPTGPRGVRTEVRSPRTDRTVHHDPYGHRFPDGGTVPPHYGVEGPGIQGTTHHTYPSAHDPRLNR